MSKIEVAYDGDSLEIIKNSSRVSESNIEKVEFNSLEIGNQYTSKIRISNKEDHNKILFFEKLDDGERSILVYSKKDKIKYIYGESAQVLKKIVKLRYKVLKVSLNKKRVKVKILAFLLNEYRMNVEDVKFFVDEKLFKICKLNDYNKSISKIKMIKDKNIYTFKFNIEDILKDDSLINGNMRFNAKIEGIDIDYYIAKKDKKIKKKRYYYNPIKSIYVKDYAMHIRRSFKGGLVLVKRKKEPIEDTLKFKFLESKIVSQTMYSLGKTMQKFRRKKINVFYEKFASKTEEGAYDLFLLFQKYRNTKNYFVISEDSPDYEAIKNVKGVVKKYSFKYYWIIYNATNFIATEAPTHINVIRSNNGILRKSLTDKRFIFLQHGVTYLKCHGRNSPFRKGKEGEVSYIVVGSEKEKDITVEMLNIDEDQVLKTGLPIFSKIGYNHINEKSTDYITVMLTWKPYEEQLYRFEDSSYYKNVVQICNMLKKYVDKDKIIIIAHPKAQNLLENTDLKNSLWDKPISEALNISKLLITDYSSVCYNSFYQGAGVIFFQPDLEFYENENGKLIPNDDEYIGIRAYSMEELENAIKLGVKDKKINLDKYRTEEYINNYLTINEFNDGKNIDRIYDELKKLDIL